MPDTNKTFQCIVISPNGRVLDCRAQMVVFPAHDGMVGILPNHMPMFCELGLGFLEATPQQTEAGKEEPEKILVMIDDGFGMVSSNLLTIIATEAINVREAKTEKIKHLIDHSKKELVKPITAAQRLHETKRQSYLERILKMLPEESHAEAPQLPEGLSK